MAMLFVEGGIAPWEAWIRATALSALAAQAQ